MTNSNSKNPTPPLDERITISATNPWALLRELTDKVLLGYRVPEQGMLSLTHAYCVVDLTLTGAAS